MHEGPSLEVDLEVVDHRTVRSHRLGPYPGRSRQDVVGVELGDQPAAGLNKRSLRQVAVSLPETSSPVLGREPAEAGVEEGLGEVSRPYISTPVALTRESNDRVGAEPYCTVANLPGEMDARLSRSVWNLRWRSPA